jgi:hypothetical protein
MITDYITLLKELPELTPQELGEHRIGHRLTQPGAPDRHRKLVARLIMTSIQYMDCYPLDGWPRVSEI